VQKGRFFTASQRAGEELQRGASAALRLRYVGRGATGVEIDMSLSLSTTAAGSWAMWPAWLIASGPLPPREGTIAITGHAI